MKIKELVREFFDILNTIEDTDSGTEFYPVQISSCRVLLSKRINEIFKELKEKINYKDKQ